MEPFSHVCVAALPLASLLARGTFSVRGRRAPDRAAPRSPALPAPRLAMRRHRLALFAALLALPLSHAAPAAAQPAAPRTEPCAVPGYDGPARCGTLEVWEDRAAGRGRRIGVRFVVLPAPGAAKAGEAVAYLAGGPGQASTAFAAQEAARLATAREGRDLLFMDARGTGGSNPLHCERSRPAELQGWLSEFFTAEGVARCAEALRPVADVRLYGSAHAAADLEELRAALGYARLTLHGGSYGTRTALVYLRRHPERVRAILMEGAVPTDLRYPLTVAPDAQAVLDGVLADCARDAACRAAFPDPAADLRESLRRFGAGAGAVEATVVSPVTGEPATVRLTRERYVEALRYMTYGPASAALVPAVVRRAAAGDFGPAAEQAIQWRRGLIGSSSDGVYLAVTCPEDVAFADSAEGVRRARGTYLGDWRVTDQKAGCRAWPHDRLDASFVEPVRSPVPLLVLNGALDPATALHHAERMVRGFPNGRLVAVPSGGHSAYGLVGAEPCLSEVMAAFVRTTDARGVDASCVGRIRRGPFPTEVSAGRVVAMDSAALARFEGRYVRDGAPPLELRVREGRLHASIPGLSLPVIPIAPLRFRYMAVPHVIATFREENGVITGFDVADGGAPPERYRREDAPAR